MAVKYLSNRLKNLKVGISNYSEDKTSVIVTGHLGIGTDDATAQVSAANTSILAAGIVTAYQLYSTLYGEFKGGSVVADNIVGDSLSISGISTLGTVKVSSGIVTATSGIVTYYGDGSNLSGVGVPGISTTGTSTFERINVTGVSTFGGLVNIDAGGQANTFKVEDLTDNRVVIAGSGGELEDSANLTFDGSTLAVTGDATFSGNVSIAGTLTKEDVTNIDSVGLITARSGVRITAGGLVVTAGVSTFAADIKANGNVGIDSLNVTGVSTFVGITTQQSTLFATQVSVAGISTFGDDVTFTGASANAKWNKTLNRLDFPNLASITFGNAAELEIYTSGSTPIIEAENNLNLNANTVAISTNLTVGGISTFTGNIDANGDLDVDGITNLDDVSIAGVTTFSSTLDSASSTLGSVVMHGGLGVSKNVNFGADFTVIAPSSVSTFNGLLKANKGIHVTSGVTTAGIITGATYYGDGSNLTGVSTTGATGGWNPDSQYNLYAGTTAGEDSDADTYCNIGIGYSALHSNCAGDKNIAIGACAGSKVLTGGCNIFLGTYAGKEAVGAGSLIDNIAIGKAAGKCLSETYFNVFIGTQAGEYASTGHRNILIGHFTGCKGPMTGCNNTFLGEFAGRCNTSGDNNIGLGELAMGTGVVTGNNNISIGKNAGCSVTGGCYNIFLGMLAGNTNTSGCNNIAIGCDVELPSATGNTQLAIGAGATTWISGDSSFNVTLAGIVTAYASGIVSATSFYGDGSNLTGTGGETLITGVTVKEESSTVGTAGSIKVLDFQGASVTATASGSDTAVITVAAAAAGLWESNATGIHTLTNVGIGTTTASPATLTVDVGTAVTAVSIAGTTGQLLTVNNKLIEGSIFSVNDISGVPSIDVDADGTIQLAPTGTTEMVGIGTTNPTSKLHVFGDAYITGVITATAGAGIASATILTDAGINPNGTSTFLNVNITGIATAADFNSSSDIKLKTNVQRISDPLDKIIRIEGVSFNWKKDNSPSIGVIANELEKVLPELVTDSDPKAVNYNGLIGVLIEAVKEQQSEIDSLKERISKLE